MELLSDGFLILSEELFPGVSTIYCAKALEFFAHYFAMGVMTDSKLQQYDPFPRIKLADKLLFDTYTRTLARAL